jgi:bis(5'-nucleosyl)-tetraphosphatase (symmetrical)
MRSMPIYAIGDVQGCYDELQRLLQLIRFDPTEDRLWFAGDLINRGPESLPVLRFIKGLGERAVCVLGNHDLHLLAVSEGNLRHFRNDTVDEILAAPDREELLEWLRRRPLMHREHGFNLLHAGLPPQWDIPTALQRAREVEEVLRGPGFHAFCQRMYGNQPDRWDGSLAGMARLRYITNCFSRLRYCDASGRLRLEDKGPPGTQKAGFLPWFEIPGRASRNEPILFGHWSTLGLRHSHNTWALDSGCLWGGRLTALRLEASPEPFQVDCPEARRPGLHKRHGPRIPGR